MKWGRAVAPRRCYVCFTLFNGAGKLRAKEGGNRELKRWRTVAISTGEMDIETFLSAGGLKVKAGQLVRLPIYRWRNPYRTMSTRTAPSNTPTHSKRHIRRTTEPQAVNGLNGLQATSRRQNKLSERRRALAWPYPADYGEQVHRVGERFAILEAALVLGYCHWLG